MTAPINASAYYEALLAASLDAIILMDKEGLCIEFNPAAEKMFGHSRGSAIGRPVGDLIVPAALRDAHHAGMERYLATGSSNVLNKHVELTAARADGSEFPVEVAIVPINAGPDVVFAGYIRDISARKHNEMRRTILLQESNHRIKNILTVVQSIASRTFIDDRPAADARHLFAGRLVALAHSNAALTTDLHTSASLAEIVDREISTFGAQAEASGPMVALVPSAAQTFSLILHELATNAAKYGALSTPGGKVMVHWRIYRAASIDRIHFEWRESGGPPVVAPSRKGFGSMMLESIAAKDFGSRPEISFNADGLVYALDAPLEELTAED